MTQRTRSSNDQQPTTSRNFTGDERAASFNVGYISAVGITTVLLIGLIIGVGAVLDSQQDRAVGHQAEVIGDQAAAGVMATDRLGDVGDGTNATVTRDLPSEVVGTPYHVRLVDTADGPQIEVDAVNGKYVAEIPIRTDADVKETTVTGGMTMEIVHEYDPETGEREIWIQPEDQSPITIEEE